MAKANETLVSEKCPHCTAGFVKAFLICVLTEGNKVQIVFHAALVFASCDVLHSNVRQPCANLQSHKSIQRVLLSCDALRTTIFLLKPGLSTLAWLLFPAPTAKYVNKWTQL